MLNPNSLLTEIVPTEFMSELTWLQKKMFICNKSPLYRLPLFYLLEEGVSFLAAEKALYQTIQNHLTLQVKYFYEPETRRFYQKFIPMAEEQFQIPVQEIDGDIANYIINRKMTIDLREQYPWQFQFITQQDKKYLYIEFHHICIDGLGIRIFEDTFLQWLHQGISNQQSRDFSMYNKIAVIQEQAADGDFPSNEFMVLPPMQTNQSAGVDRLTQKLSTSRVERIQQLARKNGVTKNAVYQAIMEEVLQQCCKGEVYGMIGNWRMSFRQFSELGCFVNIQPKRVMEYPSLDERMKQVFGDNVRTFFRTEHVQRSNMNFPIVYSYEEDMFNAFQFIPVDQLCKFDIYLRIHTQRAESYVEVEYNKAKYKKMQILQLCEQFGSILDGCEIEGEYACS